MPTSLFEENAAILRGMEADGSDLGQSRIIDFAHIFPDQPSAEAFARAAAEEGFAISVKEVEELDGREENPWDVIASKDMVPSCQNITDVEERLDILARSHRGQTDGWGFFRV